MFHYVNETKATNNLMRNFYKKIYLFSQHGTRDRVRDGTKKGYLECDFNFNL